MTEPRNKFARFGLIFLSIVFGITMYKYGIDLTKKQDLLYSQHAKRVVSISLERIAYD